MKTDEPKTIHLRDYRPPHYWIDTVKLDVQLSPDRTIVLARLSLRRNTDIPSTGELSLQGEKLELLGLKINGTPCGSDDYQASAEDLTIFKVPDRFELEIETAINPSANTELEGLFMSNGMFCTQCEAEGFRKITYFLDRPDVMAVYTTRITADKNTYPVLLSNGNKIGAGGLEDGRHWAEWHDPFPKPSYLFALVAGKLACVEDNFETIGGRSVALEIYVEPGDEDRCDFAMASLKKAMAWDEQKFGREYDLDIFMIVAVSHFNMGAMENKGLNIFNSQYILARPDTATDLDYELIESIIAHEYFHNWTGNRITCRDWFQLCLKEGLTVYRDQEFSADVRSRAVKRIQDVRMLRTRQFQEDASPLAHPVMPSSYIEINNFYTATVYEKGAEVVRMIATLLGQEGFRKGMDLYFERHDGHAATVDDFVACMEDATGEDLSQFSLWYSQAGTPSLKIKDHYDEETSCYEIDITQSCPPTPETKSKKPFQIPIRFALINNEGKDMLLNPQNKKEIRSSDMIVLTSENARFRFQDVPSRPLPSLLRGFSAPVNVEFPLTHQELGFLMAHDGDPFNRWQAGQNYGEKLILQNVERHTAGQPLQTDEAFISAVRQILNDEDLDPFMKAEMLLPPSEANLARVMPVIDPVAIHHARNGILVDLACALKDELFATYQKNRPDGPYSPDGAQAGHRTLANRALGVLVKYEIRETIDLAFAHFQAATNMTDTMGGLMALRDSDCAERDAAVDQFYDKWQKDPLVVNKWLSLQAGSARADTLNRVQVLLHHEAFSLSNPNKVRALIGSFAINNPFRFHAEDGEGYELFGDIIRKLDPQNPQLAARLLGALENWRDFDETRQALMRAQLVSIRETKNVSKNVFEIASKLIG